MDYFTAKQAAEKWGITANRITILCKGKKIPGAIQIGTQWMIPNGTQKPMDGRTKSAKKEGENYFRFPLYVNCTEESFFPALSEEEILVRSAQLDYYACRFTQAQQVLDTLSRKSENIYIRIISLFYLCSLSIQVYGGDNFFDYSHRLQLALATDFPHKKDMAMITPWLYTIMVQLQSVSDSLDVDPLYDYAPSVQPLISYLSTYHLSKSNASKIGDIPLDVYEMLCRQMTQAGHYYEACELHFVLFLAYYVSMQKETMLYHLRTGLTLARDHELYIIAASYEYYYQDAFSIAFRDFPEDFVRLIKKYGDIISKSIGRFGQTCHMTDIFITLSKNDYRYLVFAFQGNTNKEIANALGISERTVAAHYAILYEKLGVKGRQELVKLCSESLYHK